MEQISKKLLSITGTTCTLLWLASCSTYERNEAFVYNSNEYIANSLSFCHSNKFDDGLEKLSKIMTNEKENPHYWNALGICYFQSNQTLKAIFYYELGLEALNNYKNSDKKKIEAALNNNMGLIHLSYKRFNEAFLSFSKSDKLSPNLFSVQFNLAQLYLEFNYNEKSLAILQKLELGSPGNSDVLYSIALIYSRKNEFEKALLTLSKISPINKSRSDIAGVYAYNLLKTNQLLEAKSIIDNRLSSEQYELRNKVLEKEISAKLKEQTALKK